MTARSQGERGGAPAAASSRPARHTGLTGGHGSPGQEHRRFKGVATPPSDVENVSPCFCTWRGAFRHVSRPWAMSQAGGQVAKASSCREGAARRRWRAPCPRPSGPRTQRPPPARPFPGLHPDLLHFSSLFWPRTCRLNKARVPVPFSLPSPTCGAAAPVEPLPWPPQRPHSDSHGRTPGVRASGAPASRGCRPPPRRPVPGLAFPFLGVTLPSLQGCLPVGFVRGPDRHRTCSRNNSCFGLVCFMDGGDIHRT